jgi:hypothetical protein
MFVVVMFFFMLAMPMVMAAMPSGRMIMFVAAGPLPMAVRMFVIMWMGMTVLMDMLVGMRSLPVGVLMLVGMAVAMLVFVTVSMFTFHFPLLPH